jgi:hypothetical protein
MEPPAGANGFAARSLRDLRGGKLEQARREEEAMDVQVIITIFFCMEILLVALGGGFIIRYEVRRDAANDRARR